MSARVNTFDAEDMEGGFLRDILRGPSSSLYGSDALGGVVRTGIGPNITAPQDPPGRVDRPLHVTRTQCRPLHEFAF